MCGRILGCRKVAYHNWVTVALNFTSDLVSRNCIESHIFFEIGIQNLVFRTTECYIPFSGHCDLDLTSDGIISIIVSGAYLLYFLR